MHEEPYYDERDFERDLMNGYMGDEEEEDEEEDEIPIPPLDVETTANGSGWSLFRLVNA